MDRIEILNKLTPIFKSTFSDDSLVLTENMTTDDFENWDSVIQLMIVAMIEKEFKIEFKLKEIRLFDSVKAFIDGIERKLL